jgi:hypothetical protein
MLLEDYYSETEAGICFTRKQASAFAKGVAADFNPLHDEDAKLFCVPGDLLFSLTLAKFGLSQQMCFTFSGMVSDQVPLHFASLSEHKRAIVDEQGKEYLIIEGRGEVSSDARLIREFTHSYVKFSGHNFQHILVPLMHQHGVMLNPKRPLVMYQSMSVELNTLDITGIELELVESVLEVKGKKGDVRMEFCLMAGGAVVGRGIKRMAVRGLQPYEAETVALMVKAYEGFKAAYQTAG